MAKFYGIIGFIKTEETSPGVWTENVAERYYYGDVNRNTRRWESSNNQNDNLNINNEISIVADPYAIQNFHAIKYAEWMGSLWKINSIDVQYPRLILSIGGVYNGKRQ